MQHQPRQRERLAAQSAAGPPGRHAAPRAPGQRGSHWNATFGSLSRPPAAVGAAASAGIPMGLPSPANRWPWPGDVPAGFSGDHRAPGGYAAGRGMPGGYAPAEPAAQRLARRGVPATHSSARAARRRRAALRPTSTRRRIAAMSVLAVIALTLVIFQFTFRVAEAWRRPSSAFSPPSWPPPARRSSGSGWARCTRSAWRSHPTAVPPCCWCRCAGSACCS